MSPPGAIDAFLDEPQRQPGGVAPPLSRQEALKPGRVICLIYHHILKIPPIWVEVNNLFPPPGPDVSLGRPLGQVLDPGRHEAEVGDQELGGVGAKLPGPLLHGLVVAGPQARHVHHEGELPQDVVDGVTGPQDRLSAG